ncbi:MAG: hypothetical protein GY711_02050 [bacterium]|nr:hypothetical protein [bacterium]
MQIRSLPFAIAALLCAGHAAGRAVAQCAGVPLDPSAATHNARFGEAIALDGETVLVGAWADDELGVETGAAYVFEQSGGAWNEAARLLPDDLEPFTWFGFAVDLDGTCAVVGAPMEDEAAADAGAAYVFERVGGIWSLAQEVLAADAEAFDRFGGAVAVDGSVLVCGAIGDDDLGTLSGAAYVFERSGGSWVQTAKLPASDGSPTNWFGQAVDVEGDTIVVGADGADGRGAVYVFGRAGATWVEVQKLVASDRQLGDRFGRGLALSGGRLLVGAPWDDHAHADAGAAYVFEHDGAAWVERAKLVSSAPAADQYVGERVALDGDRALVGQWLLGQAPAAHLFEAHGGGWALLARLDPPAGPGAFGGFGADVALDGERGLVGEPRALPHGLAHLIEPLSACYVPTPIGTPYCAVAVPNSTGLQGRIAAAGDTQVLLNDVVLTAGDLPPQRFGYFLASLDQAFVLQPGGSQGILCLGGTIARYASDVQSSGATGHFELALDLTTVPTLPPHAVAAGETWSFQAWHRDVVGAQPTSNFTTGVAVTFR